MTVGFGRLGTRAASGIATLLLFASPSVSTLYAEGLVYDESDQWQEGRTAELWQCNLRDNANFTALKGVIDSWNAYADAAGWADYSAKLLTPISAVTLISTQQSIGMASGLRVAVALTSTHY